MNALVYFFRFYFNDLKYIVVLPFLVSGFVSAQNKEPIDNLLSQPVISDDVEALRAVASDFYVVTPARLDFNKELLGRLDVPEGFSVSVFAEGLENARII